MKKEHIQIEINELKENPKNPKLHKDELIEKSIKELGFVDDLVIDENNLILSGHGRLKALKKLGIKKVDAIKVSGWTEKEKEKYALISNKLVEAGGWDFDLLKGFDEGLLLESGFDFEELDKIFLGEATEDDFDAEAEYEKIKEPKVKLGDLFQLGLHRLLCGDSTLEEDVKKLMGREKADMVFTDPPYSVNYERKNREILKNKSYSRIEGDNLSVDKIAEDIWRPVFKNMYDVAKDDCSFYMTMPQGGDQMMMMMMMMMSENWQVKHELIWLKPSPVFSMGRLDYDYKHEPIIFGWKDKHNFYGQGDFTKSVWEIGRESDKSHPTMKPVKLIANALLNSSKREDIIIDLFGGSGSTLTACEQLNRRCFMMEIDPVYCQVIIERFEKLTNQKATKIPAVKG